MNHLNRQTFTTSRMMDFFSEKELTAQIGHAKRDWPAVCVKELVDNALDACEDAGIAPEIEIHVDNDGITISDNGVGLSTVEGLVYRALLTSNISPSAVFRCIDEWAPSLLIDESDTFMKDNDELNGVINAGHTKRTAIVIRTEKLNDGFKPVKFSVWCPQVIAGIGEQRGTLHDRVTTYTGQGLQADSKALQE